MGGTKLERFLPKNQRTQETFFNFENWCNGELSKIGHHFCNKVILKTDYFQKIPITKDVLLKQYSLMKKKMRNIRMIIDKGI